MQIGYKLILCTLFICSPRLATAQYADSVFIKPSTVDFWEKDVVKKTTIPVILLGATALVWPHKEQAREVRNRFIPTFRYHFDDYLQYAPAATVLMLNAFNVKGKHSPKRTFVSYAISMAIMGTIVNGIKHTAKVERPDARSRNSFPSGHTAMSFMNATVLNKEYGQYRHPLYGIAGYGMATATALGRGLNNRHWVPDVLAGAAIGILSAEAGYLITDHLFKNRGMNAPLKNNPIPISEKPSFMEIHLGYANATSRDLATVGPEHFNAKRGFNFGLEGAWFLTKNFGLGAEFAFTSFPINSDNVDLEELSEISNSIYTQALGVRYLNFGPYFSLPLPNNWFLTAKVNGGISTGTTGNIILNLNEEYENILKKPELPLLKYKPKSAPSLSVGAGIQKRIGRNTAIKAYATYFSSVHNFEIRTLKDDDDDGVYAYEASPFSVSRLNFSHITFGLGLTAFIW